MFILLSSEKNEPRSAAAVIGLLACRYGRRRGLRNSLHSNSPRPFPSVFLATSPPDKGGIGDCCFCLYSNPLALWALPLYSLTETQGERLRFDFVAIAVFHPLCFINPSVLRTPPLYFAAQNTPQCCGTRQGERVILGLLLSLFINPSVLWTPPLYLLRKTPRNATGHGRGGVLRHSFIM